MYKPSRVIVVGAGAIGAPIGAMLHEQGVPVVLVARGAHGRALADHGLDLRLPEGRSRTLRPPVVADVSDVGVRDGDLVLLTVMAQHTAQAVHDLPTSIPVVSLQNGLSPLSVLVERGNPVVGGVVYVPAERRAPGVVTLAGAPRPGLILLGGVQGAAFPRQIADWLAEALAGVGFRTAVDDAVGPWVRAKLLSNLLGIVVALCDDPPGDVMMMAQDEARAVWTAAGEAFEQPAALIARVGPMQLVAIDGHMRKGGSTRHALGRGQALETESLHGPIVELGRTVGVATPVNEALIALATQAHHEGWAPGCMSQAELAEAVRRGRYAQR